MTSTEQTETVEASGLSRRDLLVRGGAVGLGVAAVGVLAACGASSSGGSGGSGGAGGSGGGAAGGLAKVSDIPVGGALATKVDGKPVLLVQQTAGTVTALSAICTHQGCTVMAAKSDLECPCHGSVFALDGSVKQGPAPSPLPPVDVHVVNGTVMAGKG
ncbi:ubiquinol-cytochrome c reductase iron-sulfur subunit [Cellulomonas sp. SG140]|uniref:QcrA and Rieske domain-containing protein n=1 Tax=Cellulomonas sp. SG140 TaxID=2976536 RepID=UPI0021E8C332|nr:Rieske (2Fe-2S) protein [Cellulomonas sp. SG140]